MLGNAMLKVLKRLAAEDINRITPTKIIPFSYRYENTSVGRSESVLTQIYIIQRDEDPLSFSLVWDLLSRVKVQLLWTSFCDFVDPLL